jgi:hypothetical protein
MPDSNKHHQAQFPDTPSCLTRLVTRLGVSAENVVATIDTPNSHHGMFLPDKKNSEVLDPAVFDTTSPISRDTKKKAPIRTQSKLDNTIGKQR